ncbi:MAG: hypothetical protein IJT30_03970 [Muribaculaceae bacterium]|nr:hypothetical protein [Muribaculaceae bacterium]
MATSCDNSRQIVEVELPFVRRNKRTFFDASHEAMCIAMSVGKSLAPDKRE